MTATADIATTETHSHLMATATIVAAFAPKIDSARVEGFIAQVRKALLADISEPEPTPEIAPISKVSKGKSVTPDAVTCMHCGFVGKSLKRHLLAQHSQTPESYRKFWNLPSDHPIVSPNYSAKRSELAKANGLGRKPL